MCTPKKGDRVFSQGMNGTFIVSTVKTNPNTVDLKLVGAAEYFERDVPWGVLTYADREDTSQAAARIARESTRDE